MPRVPGLLTIGEAAAILGCSPRSVKRRIAAGALPAFRDGRLVRVPELELLRYVADRTTRAAGHALRPSPAAVPSAGGPTALLLASGLRLSELEPALTAPPGDGTLAVRPCGGMP